MSKRKKAFVLAVVPGLGHLYLGRHWRGLAVFSLFALAANGAYMAGVIIHTEIGLQVYALCVCAIAATWGYSVLHVLRITRHSDSKPMAERKDYHFRRGLNQYLAGAFDGAAQEFLTVLKLDPLDVDARFHLAKSYQALGERRKARRAFRRCMADDLDAKWRWEITSQLGKLSRAK